jgi:endonuclease YncB( thermonuclease family)
LIVCALLIVALVALDQRGWLFFDSEDDVRVYHGRRFNVTRVIDGDTIEIDCADSLNRRAVTRVRLWGVNCPELAFHDRSDEPGAAEAADFTRTMTNGRQVLVWLETHQTRDEFGAILAHLELDDGQKLNELMIQSGLARADDRWPHRSLVRFAQLEAGAQRAKVGLWQTAGAPKSALRN